MIVTFEDFETSETGGTWPYRFEDVVHYFKGVDGNWHIIYGTGSVILVDASLIKVVREYPDINS